MAVEFKQLLETRYTLPAIQVQLHLVSSEIDI